MKTRQHTHLTSQIARASPGQPRLSRTRATFLDAMVTEPSPARPLLQAV
jgi:hypothetical protein